MDSTQTWRDAKVICRVAVRFAVLLAALPAATGAGPALAQASEIKYLRTWQAPQPDALAEVGGLALAPDGAVLLSDRGKGALLRLAGEQLTVLPVAGDGRAFASKKLGGVAALDNERFALVGTGNDTVALLDAKGTAGRVFGGGNDFFGGGSGDGELKKPEGLAFSAQRRLYVADSANGRVAAYSADGVFLRAFGDKRSPETALAKPFQVAIDGAERVHVLEDEGDGRVTVFDHDGRILKRLAPATVAGAAGGRWKALAADRWGRLLVADDAKGQIVEIDWEAAQVRRRFGSPGSGRGQFTRITGLAVSGLELAVLDTGDAGKVEFYRLPDPPAATAGPGLLTSVRLHETRKTDCDHAYALAGGDTLCLRREGGIVRLDRTGSPKATFAEAVARPTRAAADAQEIAVAGSDGIGIYGHDGRRKFKLGRSGSRDGEFDEVGGLHLSNLIYVADTGNRRVQMFTRDGILVNKLEDGDKTPRRIARPTAVVTDAVRNLYVADGETKTVQVYSPKLEWQRALVRPGQPWTAILGLAVDADDHLYVLGTTESAKQVVDVFRGDAHEFGFAAYRGPKADPGPEATLSVPQGGDSVVIHDAKPRELAVYQLLEPPEEVRGVEVRGEPAAARLGWQKSDEGFVAAYRVYGAPARDGAFERVAEVTATEARIPAEAAQRLVVYRVAAVSRLGVEGQPSTEVEDKFRAPYRDFQAGRHEAAVAGFTRALQGVTDDPASVEHLGRSLLALGRHDAALAQFQDLARRPGRETAGKRLEARTLAAAGDLLGARSAVERAIAAGHADAATYQLCGEIALQQGDANGAVRCLETALGKDPGAARLRALLGDALVHLGAVAKGLETLDAATAAAPADAETWRIAGRVLAGLGRHRDALARYAKVLELAPRDADALLASAAAHLALGETQQARSIALSLVGNPVQESRGQYVIGRIATSEKKPEEAVVAFARATRLDERNGAAWLGLAEAYLTLKDEKKARDALQKAAALPDAGGEVFRLLARIESEGGRHAAALPAFEKAVALAPGDGELRLAHARTLAALERWSDAGRAAREALRLLPKNVDAHLIAAEAAHRQGKTGESIATLRQALALEPDNYAVRLRLGRSHVDANAYDEAQAHFERAAQLEPRKDEPQLMLAKVHLDRRAFDAAIAALTLAVEYNPSPANQRELDAAYAAKKKAQSGTTARVVLEDLRLARIFVAAHKQYASEELGRVRVRNDSSEDYKGLRVSFFVKEYMDFPVTQTIPELKAGAAVEVPLHATFNQKVLGIDEDTRVLAVVGLGLADARDGTQEVTKAITLYGKNAILWANGNMVGSFVTPKDDTLRNFVRESVTRYGPPPKGALNRALGQAAAVYNTLSALGLRYQVDPNSPYSKIAADQVDYVQFPRETLRLKSGDCDDLSVLLAAAYENLGIDTALVDVPGHLFLMFRTGVAEADRGLISLQDDLLVVRDGQIWIPLESTLIATSFTEAWNEGARRYREADAAKQVKVLPLRQAWEKFPPAGLAPAAAAIEVPASERVTRLIEREQRILIARRLETEVEPYRKQLAADPKNADARLQIGTLYARNGVFDVALQEFDAIIAQQPRHAAAHNNRGNVFFAQGDFERALDAYRHAEDIDPADQGIRINAALAYYRLGKLAEAKGKFREATRGQKEVPEEYRAFAKLLTN